MIALQRWDASNSSMVIHFREIEEGVQYSKTRVGRLRPKKLRELLGIRSVA